MGVLTDYFVADEQQLAETFAGWYTVASEPVEMEVTNPFTGQLQTVQDWPRREPIGQGEVQDFIDIRHLPHVQMKRIDHVKLATLQQILARRKYQRDVGDYLQTCTCGSE